MAAASRSAYDLVVPAKIAFGWGRRREVGSLARTLGARAFIVHGSRALEGAGTIDEIESSLRREGMEVVRLVGIHREPRVQDVDGLTVELHERGATRGDFLLAVGGGSAIDLAKAAAALATNRKSPTVRDYLEGVGSGFQVEEDPLPLMAIPTTAGTGSEATKNAVISSADPPFKKSIRSDRMMPRVVLVDPELTMTVPRPVTAATGMDAVTQLIESYFSLKAAPVPQALSLQGLALAARSLVRACRDGSDREAREGMSHAALLSGICLANAGLGLAHGVAPALGIHADVPHGLACAVMLPVAMRVNLEVRQTELSTLGEVLCGRRFASTADGARAAVEKVEELCADVGIPRRLGDLGVRREQLQDLVRSSRGSSMSGNPRQLDDAELGALLESIL